MNNSPGKLNIKYAVSAAGKVILFGEHSVVYGKLAVAASLGRRTVAHVTEINSSRGTVILELPQLAIHLVLDHLLEKVEDLAKNPSEILHIPRRDFSWRQPEGLDVEGLKKFVTSVMSGYGISYSGSEKEYAVMAFLKLFVGILLSVDTSNGLTNGGGICVQVESSVPMRAGLGSSAAYGVCLSGALLHLLRKRNQQIGISDDKNISKDGYKPSSIPGMLCEELDLVSHWAFISEVLMHGQPSGLDNTVCTFGHAVRFRKGDKPELTAMPPGLKILLVDTGVPRNTAQLVKTAAAKCERLPNVFGAILDAMEFVALEAVTLFGSMCNSEASQTIASSSVTLLEELIDLNQLLLVSLGVSHPRLDAAVRMASEMGLHAKLTGAGGGGYAFVLEPLKVEVEKIQLLQKQLTEQGFSCTETELGGPGVMVDEDCSLL